MISVIISFIGDSELVTKIDRPTDRLTMILLLLKIDRSIDLIHSFFNIIVNR